MAKHLQIIARVLLMLTLALWLGGLIVLFVFIQALFAHDRPTALAAGPLLFHVFDIYQRLLAMTAVLAAVVLAWKRGGASAWVVLSAVLLCGVGAAVMAFYIMPQMQGLMAEQRSGSEQFRSLHGLSMMVYLAEAALLLAALTAQTLQRPRAAQA